MSAADYFADSYRTARAAFQSACEGRGTTPLALENPICLGVEGERLTTDVALLAASGRPSKLLIVNSATHGVEGFCGSACQIALLRTQLDLVRCPETAVLLVHALNPYGFSYLRRVNEDNVDLNRNFVAHGGGYPGNDAYARLHPFLLPAEWEGASRIRAEAALRQFIAEHGEPAYQAAVSLGQYAYPDGLFYGGNKPVWSNRTWHRILEQFTSGYEHIALVDLHTGLGPYGYGEPIAFGSAASGGPARAQAWYGPSVTCLDDGSSVSAPVIGTLAEALYRATPVAAVTAIALEFGTLAMLEVEQAVRADNWLHWHGEHDSAQGIRIKRQLRDAFFCDQASWKELVWRRASEVLRQALLGLQSS